jgi:hypothetical protein
MQLSAEDIKVHNPWNTESLQFGLAVLLVVASAPPSASACAIVHPQLKPWLPNNNVDWQ